MDSSLTSNYKERLEKKLSALVPPCEITPKRLEKLVIYTQELFLWNNSFNLIGDIHNTKLSQEQKEDIFISRHICDALSAHKILSTIIEEKGEIEIEIADAGSGAGIPGVVLSIFFEKQKWNLIECSKRRCGFLQNVALLAGLSQITVLEKSIQEVKQKYDLVVFRAFRQFDQFFPHLVALLKDNGALMAYKGQAKVTKNEVGLFRDSSSKFEFELNQVEVEGIERTIVVVKKRGQA